jgi:hypothetical protein
MFNKCAQVAVLLFDENEYTRLDQEELVEKNIA